MPASGFRFGIGDIARFLGKSPVTLRSWEAKGLYEFPRTATGDRCMDLDQLTLFVLWAMANQKISKRRGSAVMHAIENLLDIEDFREAE